MSNRLSKEVKLSDKKGIDLFLDSGAYSAHTQKQTIPVDRYAIFINQHGDIFSLIANLDVIGDTGAKSWDNLKALESLGCPVMPVFHYQDDIRYLKKMLDDYPFIALGGLVGSHRHGLQIWLDGLWYKYLSHKDGSPRVKVHGFGLTDFDLMKRYPWFSLDNSSWLLAGSFGGCVFYEKGRLFNIVFSEESSARRNFDGKHYDRLNAVEKLQVDKWLKPHGVTAQQSVDTAHACTK